MTTALSPTHRQQIYRQQLSELVAQKDWVGAAELCQRLIIQAPSAELYVSLGEALVHQEEPAALSLPSSKGVFRRFVTMKSHCAFGLTGLM